MTKLAAIKNTGRVRTGERLKIFCPHCGTDTERGNFTFLLTEIDGQLEAECEACRGEITPYWSAEAVDEMVKAAVEAAMPGRPEDA